jgi:hypothetical protein
MSAALGMEMPFGLAKLHAVAAIIATSVVGVSGAGHVIVCVVMIVRMGVIVRAMLRNVVNVEHDRV